MKKLEKLAYDFVNCAPPEMNLAGIYMAGFKAAREMAFNTAQNHPNEPGEKPWGWCNICGGGPDIAKSIDKIGEEEV